MSLLPTPRSRDGKRGGKDCLEPAILSQNWGKYEPAIRRWEAVFGFPAPIPTEPAPKGGRRLAPVFPEWMMGLPPGYVTAVPGLTRNQQLKAIGNGVCPQQGVHALRVLKARFEEETDA